MNPLPRQYRKGDAIDFYAHAPAHRCHAGRKEKRDRSGCSRDG